MLSFNFWRIELDVKLYKGTQNNRQQTGLKEAGRFMDHNDFF